LGIIESMDDESMDDKIMDDLMSLLLNYFEKDNDFCFRIFKN